MKINELYVIPDVIWPYVAFGGGWGGVNAHSLFDIIVPKFSMPTVIGGSLDNCFRVGCLV